MNRKTRIPAWIVYLTLVAAALTIHACAVEFDAQSTATSVRSA